MKKFMVLASLAFVGLWLIAGNIVGAMIFVNHPLLTYLMLAFAWGIGGATIAHILSRS